jgi:hypothetical protein
MQKSNRQVTIYAKINELRFTHTMENYSYMLTKKLFLLSIFFTVIVQNAISQKYPLIPKSHFGISVSGIATADGFGLQFSPSIYYRSNRSSCMLGAIIQKQKMNVSGAQFTFEYTLMKVEEDELKRLELFCFLSGMYQANALLGKNALWLENRVNPEHSVNTSHFRFKTLEAYLGFGLRTKVCKHIQWVNCIGFGGYKSFEFPDHLYYAKHNVGLICKTGISFGLQ